MQPLTIFCPLKDSKNLFYKKTLFFICNYLILSELPVVYFIYLLLFVCFVLLVFFLFLMYNFFGIPRYLRFSVPGDCDFSVYCVILYINIYIKNVKKKFSQNLLCTWVISDEWNQHIYLLGSHCIVYETSDSYSYEKITNFRCRISM